MKGTRTKKLNKQKKINSAKSEERGVQIKVHPLFFALGFYYAITGRIFLFLTVTACALSHELGHSLVAGQNGYRLNKITLMPFGAVVSGDVEGLKPLDQIKIALAGPLLNLAVSIFFIAIWWIYPNLYPYTEVAVSTSLSLALVNMLPAYPLDGGRVVFALLSLYTSKQKAQKTCKVTGAIIGLTLIIVYLTTVKSVNNTSLLFFGAFVTFGALGIDKSGRYVRAFSGLSNESLRRGVPVKRTALDGSVTVKKMLSLLDGTCVNEIVVYLDGKVAGVISQEKIERIILSADLYKPISNFMAI